MLATFQVLHEPMWLQATHRVEEKSSTILLARAVWVSSSFGQALLFPQPSLPMPHAPPFSGLLSRGT